jgi:hypothetical protein
MQLLQDQYVCLQEKHADVVAACKLALEKPDMRQGGGVDISWRTDGAFVSNKPAIPDGIFSAGCGKG